MKAKIPANAFEIYFALGPGRSYQALAERLGVSKQAILKRALRERWQERVSELEERARSESAERAVEEIKEMNERHLKVLRAIQAKALETLKDKSLRSGIDAVRDTVASWRAEVERLGERRDEALERALARAGLARREELEDLALRVAQLEHRLRLLERDRVA